MEVNHWFVLIEVVGLLSVWPLIIRQLLLKLLLLLRVMGVMVEQVLGEANFLVLCHPCCHLFGQVNTRERSCRRRSPLLSVTVLSLLLEC